MRSERPKSPGRSPDLIADRPVLLPWPPRYPPRLPVETARQSIDVEALDLAGDSLAARVRWEVVRPRADPELGEICLMLTRLVAMFDEVGLEVLISLGLRHQGASYKYGDQWLIGRLF